MNGRDAGLPAGIARFGPPDGAEGLVALREAWRRAEARAGEPHLELRFPFVLAAARHRLHEADWRCYAALREGEVLNALVGQRTRLSRRHAALPVFQVLAEHTSDPLDVSAPAAPSLRHLVATVLEDQRDCPIIEFSRVGPLALRALEGTATELGLRRSVDPSGRSWLFDTTQSREAFDAGLGPRLARNLRRERKRMGQRWRVDLEAAEPGSAEANAAWLERFLALERSGWKGRKGTAIACTSWHRDFYAALLDESRPGLRMRWYALTADGAAVAMYLCVRAGETEWALKTAYDERFAAHSPGNELLYRLVARLIDEPAARRLHMVSGAEWLAGWKPLAEPQYCLRLFNRTLAGRGAALADRLRRSLGRT